jgi:hypothetical protein
MIFRRRETRLHGEGKHVLFSISSLATRLTRLFSRTVLGLVSPTTLFRCGTSHPCDCPIWQGGRYVLPLQHQGRAVQQEQLASLIFASARHTTSAMVAVQATIPATSQEIAVASTEPASWPEIPMSYLIAAGLMLATVFLGGLSMAAQHRETRALNQIRRDAERWAFRMAA